MSVEVFGRTNRAVPNLWARLLTGDGGEEALVEAVAESGAPFDPGAHLSKWGYLTRDIPNPVMACLGREIENAPADSVAADLIGGELVQALSSLGRTSIDFFFLSVRRALEEHQINGALACLESAREEGLVKHVGLSIEGRAMAVAGMWRFHDAFEMIRVRRNPVWEEDVAVLRSMAKERRVGVLGAEPFDWGLGLPFFRQPGLTWADGAGYLAQLRAEHPVLVGVRSADEWRACLAASSGEGQLPSAEEYRDPVRWADATIAEPWLKSSLEALRGS